MIFGIIIATGIAFIALGSYMLYLKRQKPAEYVWVGNGNDPFKN